MSTDETDTIEPERDDDHAPLGEAGQKALEAERKARKEAEQQLAALSGRVEALQRGEVERLAGERLAAPADLWTTGVTLDQLLGEDGNLDGAKLTETLDGVLAGRPHWAKPSRPSGSSDAGRGAHSQPLSAAQIADQIMAE